MNRDIIKQLSEERDDAIFDGMSQLLGCSNQAGGMTLGDFAASMMIMQLLHEEKLLISFEWREQEGLKLAFSVDEQRSRYVEIRKKAREALGDKFDELYESHKQEENEIARRGLDDNDGRLYYFVLPKMNNDGTHEPWGERDVPWNPRE